MSSCGEARFWKEVLFMEKLFAKNLIDIEPYVAGEQPKNDKIIKLNANENPYPPSPKVQEAISAFDAETLKKYPPMDAAPLRKAIAEFYASGRTASSRATAPTTYWRRRSGRFTTRTSPYSTPISPTPSTPYGASC